MPFTAVLAVFALMALATIFWINVQKQRFKKRFHHNRDCIYHLCSMVCRNNSGTC